jgi:hypothetical protein
VGQEIERHEVRFFFPQEIAALLECTGFEVCRLGSFPDFEQPPHEGNWNAMIVARAGGRTT